MTRTEGDRPGTFEVVADGDGDDYRWRLRAPNGDVLATGDPRETAWAAMRTVERIKHAVPGAAVERVDE